MVFLLAKRSLVHFCVKPAYNPLHVGVPGEVSACLRIWAPIEGEEFKGRVLYRSPEEEP
jgi:hypothetical protein